MPQKTMVCRCEDVTLDDVTHAVALGYTDIEEVKRYTGLGTGPCQGKECMAACARLLPATPATGPSGAAYLGGGPAAPFTARPPIQPVSLGALARAAGRRRAP